jgi:hypothetical protein
VRPEITTAVTTAIATSINTTGNTMTPHFAFKFANSSAALKDIHDVRFREQGPGRAKRTPLRQGKPIYAFFTQGMLVVGVPQDLIRLVGRDTIARLNGGVNFSEVGKPLFSNGDGNTDRESGSASPEHKGTRLITSVHLETHDAIHLMRIENQVFMAMPNKEPPCLLTPSMGTTNGIRSCGRFAQYGRNCA